MFLIGGEGEATPKILILCSITPFEVLSYSHFASFLFKSFIFDWLTHDTYNIRYQVLIILRWLYAKQMFNHAFQMLAVNIIN